MDNPFSKTIVFNPSMTLKERYERCIHIIGKYRSELPYLRRKISTLDKQNKKAYEEMLYWKRKYEEEKAKNKKLDREVDKLKKEIDRLTKTNNRYQVALFDHGNFKSPKRNEKSIKQRGGQIGHADTNREADKDYSSFQKEHLFVKICGRCGNNLPQVASTRQKILLDIIINPSVVKLITESERQWCGRCNLEVNAKHPRSLPFTEYGINTFMMVMILRFKCHSSLSNISIVISLSHGLILSKSDVSNLLHQAKKYLKSRYNKLIEEVRTGHIMYNDETGWLVNGQPAWMWIMANEDVTVYFAAESRGKGIMEEMYGSSKALSMHDGLASYGKSIPKDKSLYCWAHFLRFVFEETSLAKKYSTAYRFRQRLVKVYHLKDRVDKISKEKLLLLIQKELDELTRQKTNIVSIQNIQRRLVGQKAGLVSALIETKDGTNNLAERELRPIVINKKISFGSNTFSGMETTAILGSITQTLSKKQDHFLPLLQDYFQTGIKEKYPQYRHTAYFDSS